MFHSEGYSHCPYSVAQREMGGWQGELLGPLTDRQEWQHDQWAGMHQEGNPPDFLPWGQGFRVREGFAQPAGSTA